MVSPVTRAASIAVAGAIAIALGVFVVAYSLGASRGAAEGRAAEDAAHAHRAAQAARVVELVVERNPGATIRDFSGFPDALFDLSAEAGLDYRLVLALIDKESGFRPDAVGAAGEVGLMQLLPATAEAVARERGWEYRPPVRRRGGGYEALGTLGAPAENVRLGLAYLRRQVDRYKLLPVALRAYNRHPDRALERRPGDRYAEDVALGHLALTQRLGAL